MTPAGFPHSDTPGSQLGCQLPRAYRRLLRPSSALDAKASTMCPSQLATTNTTPHHTPITGTASAPTPTQHSPTTQTQNVQTASHPGGHTVVDGSTLQRCSRPLSRSQTTTPHHPPHPHTRDDDSAAGTQPANTLTQASPIRAIVPKNQLTLMPQNPNSVPPPNTRPTTSPPQGKDTTRPRTPYGRGKTDDDSTSEHHQDAQTHSVRTGRVLLRKEVIQPHLPVRLPCYDFVPIASPTFDHSPR